MKLFQQKLSTALVQNKALFISIILGALLSACGGGGNNSTSPDTNNAPNALVQAPESAVSGSSIELDGSTSSDSDGVISRWSWEQVAGPTVELSSSNTEKTRFIAPTVGTTTELVFTLTVYDNAGASGTTRASIQVSPAPGTATYTISGTISAAAFQTVDSDNNDVNNSPVSNSTLADAQELISPVTVGGYVNQAGSGESGNTYISGDIDDYFAIDLLAGQLVTLLVSDSQSADADLYLMDSDGTIIDYSIETGNLEQLLISETGRYIVNVFAFSGGTNYTLTIGSQSTIEGLQLRAKSKAEIIPGEAIVEYDNTHPNSTLVELPPDDLAWRMGMRQRAGGSHRARLLARLDKSSNQASFGTATSKLPYINDPQLRERWQTLIPIKRLRHSPGVRAASANYLLKPLYVPSDPAIANQWHYPLINLPSAWDITTGNQDVVVAVVDSGVLTQHPDLQGQFVDGYDFISNASLSGDGDGLDADPSDPGEGSNGAGASYHGSHVIGTIAALGNNGIGGSGIAYGVKIMPLRTMNNDRGTSYDIMQAIRYAAGLTNDSGKLPSKPADVINLSLGGENYSNVAQLLFHEIHQAGITVVAAAGNEATAAPSYPAAYEGVISVSAVGPQGEPAPYSNYGTSVDIAAPGGDLNQDITGDGYPDGILSTAGKGSGRSFEYAFTFAQGTSMAAPHVSAVIALMKSVNPAITATQIDQLLSAGKLTSDMGAAGRDSYYGYGLIDAYAAVNAALAASGENVNLPAQLSASATSFNFGSHLQEHELLISSSGSSPARVEQISSSQDWLSLTAITTDEQGLGRYRLNVDRTNLADGIYSARISIISSENTVHIQVLMAVALSNRSDLGTLYVLLYDAEMDEPLAQSASQAVDGSYNYSFSQVSAGNYYIHAGTDLDNDMLICDTGEACGAWLIEEDPSLLVLDSDRSNLDFSASYQVTIPTVQASQNAHTKQGRKRQPSGL